MTPLIEHLLQGGRELSFVSLVHCIEQGWSGRPAVGGSGPSHEEAVRFRCDPALSFASAETSELTLVRGDREHVSITVAFGGLVGASSPLPAAMLEDLAREEDCAALRALLDVFHHRLLGLTYRGLTKYDLARSDWRGAVPAADWVLAFCGLSAPHAERVTGLPRALLWRLAPLLATYPENAERLAVAIRVALAVLGPLEVAVHELRGGQVAIDPRLRARLGRGLRLGANTALGARAHAPSSGICVSLGALTQAQATALLPGGTARELFEATVRLFCAETIDVEVELRASDVAGTRLRSEHARLGRNAWLGQPERPAPIRWFIRSGQREERAS
jgi:type VI secretion system protein ImpH